MVKPLERAAGLQRRADLLRRLCGHVAQDRPRAHLDEQRKRDRVAVRQPEAAHLLEPGRDWLGNALVAALHAHLDHARGHLGERGVVAVGVARRELHELAAELVVGGREAGDLARAGAPDAVHHGAEERHIHQHRRRLRLEPHHVLASAAVDRRVLGERRAGHRRRGGRQTHHRDAAELRRRPAGEVEGGAAAEREDAVALADPRPGRRVDDRKRAREVLVLGLLAARHDDRPACEPDSVIGEVAPDLLPQPRGVRDYVGVRDEQHPAAVAQCVREHLRERVRGAEHVFDYLSPISQQVPAHVFLRRPSDLPRPSSWRVRRREPLLSLP